MSFCLVDKPSVGNWRFVNAGIIAGISCVSNRKYGHNKTPPKPAGFAHYRDARCGLGEGYFSNNIVPMIGPKL